MNDNRFIIRCRHSGLEPESSKIKAQRSGQCQGVASLRGECLADWIPACAGMTKQRGISLIELIMFIVIVSVALAGILLVMNVTTKGSADPLIHKQALAAAESLLEEIELQDFISASGVTNAVTQTTGGSNRASEYHIISDYNTFATSGIFPVSGVAAIAGLASYNANVTVVNAALGSIAAGSAVRITVTVTDPQSNQIAIDGYRTRY